MSHAVPTRSSKPQRSRCPISTTLEGIGDRWTLVIVRDMVMGKKRFVEFLASPERITTNVLTDRLALM
ncbi:MAG: winged helix-turn-helix transcriptional regulator, partial [Hyphomicrobium sp.]